MALAIGIVGLPNVGKSTIFNAITAANIAAQNYPFCTIEPNIGKVPVPDPRLTKIADIVKPEQVIPTSVEFVDIAGLVKGASQGEGLGNQFLANIRNTDAIAHVVRCFDDGDVVHVDGKVNPIADIDTIDTELLLADLDTINKNIQRSAKLTKSGSKEAKATLELLKQLQQHCNDGKPARNFEVNKEQQSFIDELHLITNKPVMYIVNVKDLTTDKDLINQVTEHAKAEGSLVVPICAKVEAELAELDDADKEMFLAEMQLDAPGLNRVIQTGYELLGLITFFTAGKKEVRAWTVVNGATAPNSAGTIHSDFERGFIRAEVISFDDFIACNGEAGAKEAGKWRLEGKDYITKDGDVMHFRFGT